LCIARQKSNLGIWGSRRGGARAAPSTGIHACGARLRCARRPSFEQVGRDGLRNVAKARWFKLDNAKANLADDVRHALAEFIGCFVDAGPTCRLKPLNRVGRLQPTAALRRLMKPTPARPTPSSDSVAGSGTAGTVVTFGCPRRSNFDPPCRLNFDPGMGAGAIAADCGQL
jgi:hypothetical protein